MTTTLQPNHTLNNGRYRITRILGQGGFGAVYLAEDLNLVGTMVAIKENLHTSLEAQRQFEREALLLARLRHPNLPRVTDHFVDKSFDAAGRYYLVMDYIEGEDLKVIARMHHQKYGELSEGLVMEWVTQVMDALEFMHTWQDPATGQLTPIIHRDIKPANIRVTPQGRVYLVDFGIAKEDTPVKTVYSIPALTPDYAPPEQYREFGGRTDARSDIYALGATIYVLLVGKAPLDAKARHDGHETKSPRSFNRSISRRIDNVVMRAMQMQPTRRYADVGEMRQTLLQGTKSEQKTEREVRPAYGDLSGHREMNLWVIALMGLLLLVGGFAMSEMLRGLPLLDSFGGGMSTPVDVPLSNMPTSSVQVVEIALTETVTTTPIPTSTPTELPTMTPTKTETAVPTPTPVPPTPTHTPTDTPVPQTATFTPKPTNTPTDTPVPQTATLTPTPRPTNTATRRSSTPTRTPTETPIPPTATFTPELTNTPQPTITASPRPIVVPLPIVDKIILRIEGSGDNKILHQDIYFNDLDGDSYAVTYELVSTTRPDIRIEDDYITASDSTQKVGAIITSSWWCNGEGYTVVLRATILDRAGHTSNPFDIEFDCR
ncbi:MAG: serine/threonine-protein kinase [Chloroflexota bacterium]